MRWYYLSDTQETIPTSEDQLPILAQQGLLRATTPLWHAGMEGWLSASELHPALFSGPTATSGRGKTQPHRIAVGVAQRSVWSMIAGVGLMMLGLGGVIYTIFGTIGVLGLQMTMSKLGPEAQTALRENLGPDLATSPVLLVLRAIVYAVSLVFTFIAGLRLAMASHTCRVAFRDGQSWLMEQGLNRLGKSLFWLALAILTLVGGSLILLALRLFNAFEMVV